MKKVVALFLVTATLFSLSACGKVQHKEPLDSNANNKPQESTTTEKTTTTQQTIAEEEQNLTASHIIDWVKTYSQKNGLDPVSNVEKKQGKKEGQLVTSFHCINGLVSVSVTETNGVVDYIISVCLPSQVVKKVPSDSLAEAAVGAYTYSMIPVFSCEPEIDNRWHQEQFSKAPDEGDASMVIRSYKSQEWYYTAMVGEAVVTCVAARYCSQCKTNAPNVTFTSGSQICDSCNYNSQGSGNSEKLICKQCGADCTYRGLEEDGRCEDCYLGDSNSPNVSGNSGGNSSGSGNTSQQPTSCSHSYANATCTMPQTCTKCGNTTGSAKGHSWQGATCTNPETCSVCNQTQGDALGHNMGLTKCSRCDFTDYSPIAKSYSKVTAYDSKTGEDLEVTNVSVSSAGVLSFTFNGKTHSIALKERVYDSMTYFDCYQSGSKLSNAECRIGDASYYNMLHFEWDGIDGHRLYFCTEKQ